MGTNSCRGVSRMALITRSFFTPAATISLSTISPARRRQSRSDCAAGETEQQAARQARMSNGKYRVIIDRAIECGIAGVPVYYDIIDRNRAVCVLQVVIEILRSLGLPQDDS